MFSLTTRDIDAVVSLLCAPFESLQMATKLWGRCPFIWWSHPQKPKCTFGDPTIFSERELKFRYMSSSVRLSVVCLSVTFVRPTQTIEIFGNISMPFGTLAMHDLSVKILWRSSQGNPSVGGVKHKRIAKYSDFGPIERYISETVQDRS